MFDNFHICYSTRHIDESLDITRNIRSSFFDAFATLAHRYSTHSSRSFIASRSIRHDCSSSFDVLITITHRLSKHSSRSLIVTRDFHLRILDVIYERSTSIEVVRDKLIEARANLRKEILSRFRIKDLLVRLVSTRYES